jgi:hypothetical protein
MKGVHEARGREIAALMLSRSPYLGIFLSSSAIPVRAVAVSPDEPTIDRTRRLKAQLSADRWSARVEKAAERARLIAKLRLDLAGQNPSAALAREVAPEVPLTTLRRWLASSRERPGEPWERLLDGRMPPRSRDTPELWKVVIEALGRHKPQPSVEQIQKTLVEQFGPQADVCYNTVRRVLDEAGLWSARSVGRETVETVTELSGGGALVPLLAATIESGVAQQLAEEISKEAQDQPAGESSALPEPEGRDANGRFTAEYNKNRLELLKELGVSFYRPAKDLREGKDLSRLRLAALSAQSLEQHLRCLVALPLITVRRGTGGLDGPIGGWLEILSPVAYKAATVDKTLSELKLLDATESMWEIHARKFLELSRNWSEDGWRQLVDYVDVTYDPWWTDRYAMSGKVSRTGRVQPCLARPLLSTGPGVPIIAHVVSGSAPLKNHLLSMLAFADELRGEGSVGRFTVVDAECCTMESLRHFAQDPKRDIITVMKGALRENRTFVPLGPCMPFRERDQLREGEVVLEPETADTPGLRVRVVEMVRQDSRHPKPTWFATTASREDLSTQDVAEAYLSRWPYQEDLFRRGRDGLGLDKSQGFGASTVRNVAVIDRREKAGRQLCRATLSTMQAEELEAQAKRQLEQAQERLKKRQDDDELNGRHGIGVRLAKQRLSGRQKDAARAKRNQDKKAKEYEKLQSMPDEIYVRDTALDSITTCLKMLLLALLEFINQEYLDRRRIMPHTFVEAWLALPVTIRQNRHRITYEVAPNPRDPKMTALLAQALARITERKLKANGRLLVAKMRDGPS